MAPQTRVFDEPDECERRLSELGLSVGELLAAIRFGYLARLSCNANDPASTRGFLFWARITRGLRERLAQFGWRKLESKLSLTVNRDSSMAIMVATGDQDTGLSSGEPKSRFPKGPATWEAVAANSAQGELFPLAEVAREPATTWCLLVMVERRGESTVIRSELSLPSAMDENGRIGGGWFERIVLPEITDDDDRSVDTSRDDDFGPDVDVVRRLA